MLKEKMGLTFEQEDILCYIIGNWYIKWKDNLVNYEDKTHRLGIAKENLKQMICKEPKSEEFEKCEHESNGYEYQHRKDADSPFYNVNKCKKCGEFFG